ncbi:hypothetical protein [Actinoalloteichus hymeniacidonis]|nr:hypothetical protein [Actinoalloteichus hymeniacidonis]MBB5906152.1 hypothetical protein [Actinoalloteichus hymeniacidonis]
MNKEAAEATKKTTDRWGKRIAALQRWAKDKEAAKADPFGKRPNNDEILNVEYDADEMLDESAELDQVERLIEAEKAAAAAGGNDHGFPGRRQTSGGQPPLADQGPPAQQGYPQHSSPPPMRPGFPPNQPPMQPGYPPPPHGYPTQPAYAAQQGGPRHPMPEPARFDGPQGPPPGRAAPLRRSPSRRPADDDDDYTDANWLQ